MTGPEFRTTPNDPDDFGSGPWAVGSEPVSTTAMLPSMALAQGPSGTAGARTWSSRIHAYGTMLRFKDQSPVTTTGRVPTRPRILEPTPALITIIAVKGR